MPLSRLENFLINTDGNILYVNPSDLDATDSFDNKGNSLTRPFKTLQRALIEAARFSYQVGQDNDRFDRTTILLYPGTHLVDNRRGLQVGLTGGVAKYRNQNDVDVTSSTDLTLNSGTVFDIENAGNVLHKLNSVDGGIIVPKGTSIIGLDLRKTKIKPLYVPDPEDVTVDRSAIFRITGGCYFWQFSIFDGDREVFFNNDYGTKRNPGFSHHKLTCFEYADGINKKPVTNSTQEYTDLQMYYFKLMNAYGTNTGNRNINEFPSADDFQPNSPEFKIVGDLTANDFSIVELKADTSGSPREATVTTDVDHNLNIQDSFRITGVGGSALYEGSYKVAGITSTRQFTYTLPADPNQDNITIQNTEKVVIEADNVTGASPYIFNISLRSTFGMCGMHADGSKATGFKSMVVAQFTGIGLQKDPNAFLIYDKSSGEYKNNATAPNDVEGGKPLYINQNAVYSPGYENFHVKASNDSVIQAVSVFAIGFANHFLAEDGADQSITNSNSNFGAKSLISKGFRKQSFNRDDTGYVTHIVPPKDLQEPTTNVNWRVLDPTKTDSVGITSHLYLLGEEDILNPPSNVTDGYKVGCNHNELLYLDVVTDTNSGITSTFSAPILMEVPAGTIDGPQGKKVFNVSRTGGTNDIVADPTNVITLTAAHNLSDGESIRIFSDNGRLPDGIEPEGKYFAITISGSGNESKIKIASTLNNALNGVSVKIKNNKGGIIRIESRVTDKIPGDPGHPIQYDTTNNQWYITSSSITTTNKIFEALDDFTTIISENNASTYVQRVPENRDLIDRIYKLRYVVPREFKNAKAPTKNFILQESKTVNEDSTINTVKSNRNPRVIANVTRAGATVTITSQQEHKINVGDRVNFKNIVSVGNTLGKNDVSYNGYFNVDSVPSTTTFRVSNALVGAGDTYTDQIDTIRTGGDLTKLPVFERNEYKTTYIIQDVETIQEYDDSIQDGVYYLTVLRSDISPTVSEFSGRGYKQDFQSLYPVVDRDNVIVDPEQSISAASNSLLGKVSADDTQNSITKEAVIEYIKDTGVGIAITGAQPVSGTSSDEIDFFFEKNHGFYGLTESTIGFAGGGYAGGISTTLYNVPLVNGKSDMLGADATADVVVSSGAVTGVTIVNPGSNYVAGVGKTLTITGGTAGNQAFINIGGSNDEDRQILQVVGVGTIGDRKTSAYNGMYMLSGPADNVNANVLRVFNAETPNPGIHTISNGIAVLGGKRETSTVIAGVAGTTLSGNVTVTTADHHGLVTGNRIRLQVIGATAAQKETYHKDFIIQGVPTTKTFIIKTDPGTPLSASIVIFPYAFGAQGQDTSLATEKIGGSLLNFIRGFCAPIINVSPTSTTNTIIIDTASAIINQNSIQKGDYFQIKDEIVRVTNVTAGTNVHSLTVIRGVMGTTSTAHFVGDLVQQIKIVPAEVRRFSSIRASGHTFEYIGYGPGNYSTALPQRIQRTLTREEELLSVYCEKKGGVTFFSGMNDRGEFFTWDGRIKPVERYISEVGNDFTGIFDDLYVRNTLRVGGGPNRNLPSEFRGPVNFTNKITNTDTVDGITAVKLQLQGNAQANPSFQVGSDASPSLIVKKSSQNVGIKTANPQFELDVNGTIRANVYENFKLTDLPNTKADESTFERNRILKVNNAGTGYELVDINTLPLYRLSSYGVSNDGVVHVGTGSTVGGKLQIAGVSTATFSLGQKVKMFGVGLSTSPVTVDPYTTIPGFTKIGSSATNRRYRYWSAQFNLRTGDVGIGTQLNPKAGVGHTSIDNFNDVEHISLTLNRTNGTSNGILIYRQESADGAAANINDAKLVAILGPKELGSNTSGITYKDFGVYDQTAWSQNTVKNEYDEDQIHFPNIGTEGKRRGWSIDEIVSIGNSSITVNRAYDFNDAVGFGTTTSLKVVHENTYALTQAIDDIAARGGSYLELPSGTFLAEKLIIPSNFTITGVGKNSVLKQQYFANDETDGAGNALQNDNIFIGIAAGISKDITFSDFTVDGNNTNQYRFSDTADDDSYMVYLKGLTSGLIRGIELRNSSMNGMTIKDSTRVSIENSTFVDGSLTDRYPYEPLNASETTSLRINDCLFENYPGAVDVSASSVVATGGNIIRNCGRGLKTFATGKITTTDNIILGPADEFIPSPDIFDSDFNGINVTVDTSSTFFGPVLQYIEDGEPKDISSSKVTITAGIGTMIGTGSTLTGESLGTKFLDFEIHTDDQEPGLQGREQGYVQTKLIQSQAATLANVSNKQLGYSIVGVEFQDIPVGMSTNIGIQTGAWYKNGSAFIGVGATEYRVTLSDSDHFAKIAVGDIVKLVGHSVSPSLSAKTLTVQQKQSISADEKQLRLVGFTTTSITNGGEIPGTVNGYISIRKQFVIAKGRVGVI